MTQILSSGIRRRLVAGQTQTELLFDFLNSDSYGAGPIKSTKPHSGFGRHIDHHRQPMPPFISVVSLVVWCGMCQ